MLMRKNKNILNMYFNIKKDLKSHNASDLCNFTNHFLVVELGTVQDFEFEDINNNHAGC